VENEFILITDHKALKYINALSELSCSHAKWVTYFQEFSFSLRHQSVADALSQRVVLLTTMHVKVMGFDTFLKIYKELSEGEYNDYVMLNGYLFCGLQLCILDCSLKE
jgi:hypothetical protein